MKATSHLTPVKGEIWCSSFCPRLQEQTLSVVELWFYMKISFGLTKMLLTSIISKSVGPRLKTRALSTKLIPRVPRSMALDSAPVCLLRWKPRSRLWRWRNTFLAILLMELWATFPNTAFLSSLKRAAPARDTPSENTHTLSMKYCQQNENLKVQKGKTAWSVCQLIYVVAG